ncbi:MAG: M28 family peptidase [Blastocatellia bacterium]
MIKKTRWPIMARVVGSILGLLVCASLVAAGTLPLPSVAATSSITANDLKRHLTFLASDELGGRYTLSPSNLIAARYLASELEYYGYRGAGKNGSYFQPVPLVFRQADAGASSITLKSGGESTKFKFGDDFAQIFPYDANVSGELVFVGFGVSAPDRGEDDYAGLDVKGKIVVRLFGTSAAMKGIQLGLDEAGDRAAVLHGAVASIVISPARFIGEWANIKDRALEKGQLSLPPKPDEIAVKFPSVLAGDALVKALSSILGAPVVNLYSPEGKAFKSRPLAASAGLRIVVESKPAPPAQNVAGILEGTDPVLKNEYVCFSAHYDHLETENGQIYNGADDDGSGTVSVLEIARALTVQRPKRSVLIMFHTGEELGLFGSTYNTDYNPVVPLNRIVTDLNIDMVGRSRPPDDKDPRDAHLTDENSIYIIGADKLSSELNKINQETDADTVKMRFDYTYNDESNPERFYYRSDHYNYAKHGIPVIFYFTGVHRDYHEPTDKVDKIDFAKMERIDRLIFAVGWRVANLDHRLVVDKKPAPEIDN